MARRRFAVAAVLLAAAYLQTCRLCGSTSRAGMGDDAPRADSFHTVFPVECKFDYLLWQTVGLWHTFRKVGMPGSFTRLLSCAEDKRQRFIDAGAMDICPTFVTPSFTDYHAGDSYGPYNMAGTVLHWVQHAHIKEEYILILDSDMVLLRPLLPSHLGIAPGRAVAAFYGYLKGVANDLAERHIPEIAPRDDLLAGPRGRRSDQVGGVQSMTLADLKRVAPLWLKYTEEVREDPLAWRDSGDVYVREGGKPWISEMYGYSFGCAKAGVWHTANYTMMLYPEYMPTGFPDIMHYGILFNIGEYRFDKHWYTNFDILSCPAPNPAPNPTHPLTGLLPPPPRPSELPPAAAPLQRLRHLYAAATVALLNEAFCKFHMRRCQQTPELVRMCAQADRLSAELLDELFRQEGTIQSFDACADEESACADWAAKGECTRNPGFMHPACRLSCGLCGGHSHSHDPSLPPALVVRPEQAAGGLGASLQDSDTEGREQGEEEEVEEGANAEAQERVAAALELGDFPLPRGSNAGIGTGGASAGAGVPPAGSRDAGAAMDEPLSVAVEDANGTADDGEGAGFVVWLLPLVWITGLLVLASSCRSPRPARRRRGTGQRLQHV
eukprot:jgi/Tetstr1/423192/TSEL_001312.t1